MMPLHFTMQDMIKAALLLLSGLFAGACDTLSPSSFEVGMDQQFRLRYEETALIRDAGFAVTFKKLNEDSRCPEGLRCFWEGNASVVVTVGDIDLTLNTTLEPREAGLAGYAIRLVDVQPHPRRDVERRPSEYTVTLIVTMPHYL